MSGATSGAVAVITFFAVRFFGCDFFVFAAAKWTDAHNDRAGNGKNDNNQWHSDKKNELTLAALLSFATAFVVIIVAFIEGSFVEIVVFFVCVAHSFKSGFFM